MADTIKIGNLDISAFKVGSGDCKIYLGDTLLYPQTISYKLIAQYSDTTEYKVECDGGTALTQSMVEGHTTPKSAMTSADISGCGMPTFTVGDNSFCGATNLNSVTLNEGITEIGSQAFRETTNLRSITFPSTLTRIGGTAFRLSGLREVSGIPSGVTFLSSGAFADCTSLTAATIPSSVTGSSTNLFLRDTALKEVHFERETAPELGVDVFNGCTALIKIYIPSCDCYDSYAAQSQFSGKTNIIYAEGTNTKCEPYAPSIKMVTANGWSSSADTSGNLVRINKSASSTGQLTTCVISVSGVSKVVFSLYLSNNQSGINYSSSKDNYETSTSINTTDSGSNVWTLDGLTKGNTYTIHCKLLRRSGTYVTGTNAGANITWTQ